LVGVAIGTCAYAGYGLATQGWMLYWVIAFASLGGIAMPACQAIITKSVRPDEQGAVQGGLTSATSLANVFGPQIGGHVFAWSIDGPRDTALPGLVFFVCAAIAVCGLVVVALTLRSMRDAPR